MLWNIQVDRFSWKLGMYVIVLQKRYLDNNKCKNQLKGNRVEVVQEKDLEWEEEKFFRNITLNNKQIKKTKEREMETREIKRGGGGDMNILETKKWGEKYFNEKGVVNSVKCIKNTIQISPLDSLNLKPLKNVVKMYFVEFWS